MYRLLKCHCHRLGRSRFRSVNDHRPTTPSSALSGVAALPLSLSLQGTPLIASSSTNWSVSDSRPSPSVGIAALPLSLSLQNTPLNSSSATNWSMSDSRPTPSSGIAALPLSLQNTPLMSSSMTNWSMSDSRSSPTVGVAALPLTLGTPTSMKPFVVRSSPNYPDALSVSETF